MHIFHFDILARLCLKNHFFARVLGQLSTFKLKNMIKKGGI